MTNPVDPKKTNLLDIIEISPEDREIVQDEEELSPNKAVEMTANIDRIRSSIISGKVEASSRKILFPKEKKDE